MMEPAVAIELYDDLLAGVVVVCLTFIVSYCISLWHLRKLERIKNGTEVIEWKKKWEAVWDLVHNQTRQ
jgi:hypothetical protein